MQKDIQKRIEELEKANALYTSWVNDPKHDYFNDQILIRLVNRQAKEIEVLKRILEKGVDNAKHI